MKVFYLKKKCLIIYKCQNNTIANFAENHLIKREISPNIKIKKPRVFHCHK